MHYIHSLWDGIPIIPATVILLAVFMVLTIIGITESAKVAVAIFITHLTTLTLLLLVGGIFLVTNGLDVLVSNFQTPTASLPRALFFGFAAAMLGISGFERHRQHPLEGQKGSPSPAIEGFLAGSYRGDPRGTRGACREPLGQPGFRVFLIYSISSSWCSMVSSARSSSRNCLRSGTFRRISCSSVLPGIISCTG